MKKIIQNLFKYRIAAFGAAVILSLLLIPLFVTAGPGAIPPGGTIDPTFSTMTVAGDTTIGGNAGIGTATPSEELVVGTDHGDFSGAEPALVVGGDIATLVTPYLYMATDPDAWGRIFFTSTNDLVFEIDDGGDIQTNQLVLDVSGNVGIGTDTPSEALVVGEDLGNINVGQTIVVGDSSPAVAPGLTMGESSANYGKISYYNTDDYMYLRTAFGGIENFFQLVLSKNGFVGIGTSSPGEKLVVGDDIGNVSTGQTMVVGDTSGNNPGLVLGESINNLVNLFWSTSNNALNIETKDGGTTRTNQLVLDGNGNIGIGVTNPSEPLVIMKDLGSQSFAGVGSIAIGGGSTGTFTTSAKLILGDASDQRGNIYWDGLSNKLLIDTTTSSGTNLNQLVLAGSNGYVGIGTNNPIAKLGIINTIGDGLSVNATALGTRGTNSAGKSYDFYADGDGINYGPFTGGHEVLLDADFPENPLTGLIVSATGSTEISETEDGISISSTMPTVYLATKEKDPAVLGAFVAELESLPEDHWYKPSENDRFGTVNALGEGRIWVTDITGNLKAGDLITTSNIPGYGQKQDDDLMHSYTVGKITETLDWNTVTDTIEYNGKTYKRYLIGVVYYSG